MNIRDKYIYKCIYTNACPICFNYLYDCVHTHTHKHTNTHIYVCVCVCDVCVCVCVRIYVCVCASRLVLKHI
jgi:hypothetical protein